MQHEYSQETAFVGDGVEVTCLTCTDPDLDEGVWTGVHSYTGTTEKDIQDWMHDHERGLI